MSRPVSRPGERPPWVLVAGGFHQRGGMDRANAALAEYLARSGREVHLVTHRVDPELERQAGITVHHVHCPRGSLFLGERYLDHRGRRVAAGLQAQHGSVRVVVNGANCMWPDINWVHSVHHAWPPVDADAPLWFRAKNRLVKRAALRRERAAIQRARLVVANSERTRDDLMQHLDVEPERVRTVYLGSDPAWGPVARDERVAARAAFGLPDERPVVVFVGALGYDNNKGFDVLLEAWRTLCSGGDWDADLLVAGGGRGSERWTGAIERLGLQGRVQMLGFTGRIPALLAAADLLVSPVRYEAYGLNVQEAVIRGVPALVSGRAGVAERYPDELAEMILREPEDADYLAARLRHWRARSEEWKIAFQPLAASLRAHSWSRMAAQIVEMAEGTSPLLGRGRKVPERLA